MATINGTAGADTLVGTSADDTIVGKGADDSLSGGAGNDVFLIDQTLLQYDWIDGGAGYDIIRVAVQGAVIGLRSIVGVEKIDGAGFNSWLVGTTGNDSLDFTGVVVTGVIHTDLQAGDDTLIATAGDDKVWGEGGNDSLSGAEGNDQLGGGVGDDTLIGGAGDDTFIMRATQLAHGYDRIDGGSGYDTLIADVPNAHINLQSLTGVERILTTQGGWVVGSTGDDVLDLTGATVTGVIHFDLQSGNDTLLGSVGADKVYGVGGDDYLTGAGGHDSLSGQDGDDSLEGGAGADSLTGGAGVDTAIFSGAYADYQLSIGPVTSTVSRISTGEMDTLSEIERLAFSDLTLVPVMGTSAADTMTGVSAVDFLFGLGGNDSLSGAGGNDVLDGGDGDDTLAGGAGSDQIRGGAGADTVQFAGAYADYTISMGATTTTFTHNSTGEVDTVTGGERFVFSDFTLAPVVGTPGADTLTGAAAAETFVGHAGDDSLSGGGGNDIFLVDQTSSSDGYDWIDGGAGYDTIRVTGPLTLVGLHALTGVEKIEGAGFSYSVVGSNSGEAFDLSGIAIEGESRIDLQGGDDTLIGTSDGDTVIGGTGHDSLNGGDGADVLVGHVGWDTLDGGAGDDIIRYDTEWGEYDVVDGGAGNDAILAAANNTSIGLISLSGVETISSGGFDDVFVTGSSGSNYLDFSNVTLSGIWYITGDGGADTIIGSASDEYIVAELVDGGPGNDTLVGDTVTYARSPNGVNINLWLDTAQAGWGYDRLLSVNNLIGSAGNDSLWGNGQANSLLGGAGDDVIEGNAGNDTLDGGPGVDTIGFEVAPVGVEVHLSSAVAQVTGTGTDVIQGFENVRGSEHRDLIYGDGGANLIEGAGGNDDITGGGGSDQLSGGVGDDQFFYSGTSGGFDAVDGGTGSDIVKALADNTVIGLASVTGLEAVTANGFSSVSILGSAGDNTLDFSGVTLTAITQIDGGDGSDTLIGSGAADVLLGSAGDDSLAGGGGGDQFQYAGAATGFDAVNGGADADTITATAAGAVIGLKSIAGVEVISAGGFADVSILGSSSGDALDFSAATLTGLSRIDGGSGSDTITGGAEADTLIGSGGHDRLNGGNGDDTFRYSASGNGFDVVDGGAGTDTITAAVANTIIGLKSLAGVEAINGGGFSGVSILGSGAANTLDFSAVAITGIAHIDGGAASDTITGSSAADTLIGSGGDDSLAGGGGDDVFRYSGSANGFDVVDGGAGLDTLTAAADGTAIGLSSLSGVEAVDGGGFSGVSILGSEIGDTLDFSLVTLTGIARVDGGAASDTITGSAAADTLIGSGGDDSLAGGGGDDVFRYSGSANGFDVVDGGAGLDTLTAAADGTAIGLSSLSGVEAIDAGGHAGVQVLGTSQADSLDLSSTTLSGVEAIDAGAGDDVIVGSSGADALMLGAGADTLSGSTGADRFIMSALSDSGLSASADVVADFAAGVDLLDFSALDADLGASGDQAFNFIGASAFSNTAGQLRLDTTDPSETLVLGDVDGDGVADFSVVLTGSISLSSTDFIL